MAAALRGALAVEGDPGLVVASSGSFPGRRDRTQELACAAQEERAMSDDLVKILDGNTFVVSDDAATSRRP